MEGPVCLWDTIVFLPRTSLRAKTLSFSSHCPEASPLTHSRGVGGHLPDAAAVIDGEIGSDDVPPIDPHRHLNGHVVWNGSGSRGEKDKGAGGLHQH